MPRTADLVIRSLYVIVGIAVIVFALLESTARSAVYFPILLGALLIFQGFSGT